MPATPVYIGLKRWTKLRLNGRVYLLDGLRGPL
jgi:hypothetical protein